MQKRVLIQRNLIAKKCLSIDRQTRSRIVTRYKWDIQLPQVTQVPSKQSVTMSYYVSLWYWTSASWGRLLRFEQASTDHGLICHHSSESSVEHCFHINQFASNKMNRRFKFLVPCNFGALNSKLSWLCD